MDDNVRQANKSIFFPKKSHRGYFDQQLRQHFYDKEQKRDFMNKHGIVEHDATTNAHRKRVRDFNEYNKEMKRKHGKDWKYTGAYPD